MNGDLSSYDSLSPEISRSDAPSFEMSRASSAMQSIQGYDSASLGFTPMSRSIYPGDFSEQGLSARGFSTEYPTFADSTSRGVLDQSDYGIRGFASAEYPTAPGAGSWECGHDPSSTPTPNLYPGENGGNRETVRPFPSRPLRVICVGPSFQIGGVEQHTVSLAKFFDPNRVTLVKSLVTNGDNYHKASAAGLPFPVATCSPAELEQAAGECDVLLMWGEGFNGRLGKHRPIGVYLAHGESPWTRLGLEGCSKVIDHVIAVSARVKQRVCQGFPTTTILNGIDASRLGKTRSRDAMRQKLGFEPNDFILGSIGRFTREKQMHLLIEAIARLPRPFKLLLVGYGPRRAELLDLANERIPGRYAFATADNYLGDYYGAMDAFGLVSSHEGFGLVIAEAMLCERPVIATNVGCVPEVIRDRISGIVVDPNAASIASAVRSLQQYPQWAKGIAAEGHTFANAQLHASRMARDYEDLLWRLAKDRQVV